MAQMSSQESRNGTTNFGLHFLSSFLEDSMDRAIVLAAAVACTAISSLGRNSGKHTFGSKQALYPTTQRMMHSAQLQLQQSSGVCFSALQFQTTSYMREVSQ